MLDLKYVRENLGEVALMLKNRNNPLDLNEFSSLDRQRRDLLTEVEALKTRRNKVNDEITALKKAKQPTEELIAGMKEVSARIKELDPLVAQVEEQERDFLLNIPNLCHDSTPVGASEADNVEVRRRGEPGVMDFSPKNHWELGEELGILDFGRAAKITGSRFVVMSGAACRMVRGLISFMLDRHIQKGYREFWPPFMVNSASMTGTGQLPKFAQDSFKLENSDYWLAPTAEVPITNLHRDEILEAGQLPLRYAAYTPCFRAEAGAAGRDTRGIIRLHQFDKVELVKFVRPEEAWEELEKLTADAEDILKDLELPYRVMALCTGDLGFASAKTYDLEVWLPGPGLYREISSCSCFSDFQARRAGIRYRPAKGAKPAYVYTLNGSGLAVGRTVAAILENYQQADGSVTVPEVLRPYMGGQALIAAGD